MGLLASNFLNSYSSAFSLAVVVGKDLDRKKFTIMDAFLATLVGIYMLFIAPSFWDSFQTFLDLLIVVAAPWTGIMIVYVLMDVVPEALHGTVRQQKCSTNVLILGFGILVTILFSNNPLWEGPGAQWLHGNDISPLLGAATGVLLSMLYRFVSRPAERSARDVRGVGAVKSKAPNIAE